MLRTRSAWWACASAEGRVGAQAGTGCTEAEWLGSRKRAPEGEALWRRGPTGRGPGGKRSGSRERDAGSRQGRGARAGFWPDEEPGGWAGGPQRGPQLGDAAARAQATAHGFLLFQVSRSGCQRFRKNNPGRRPACWALGAERSRRPSEAPGGPGRRGHRRDVVARDPAPALPADAGPAPCAQVRADAAGGRVCVGVPLGIHAEQVQVNTRASHLHLHPQIQSTGWFSV